MGSKQRVRAVVLAAGRGERLRPLSEWAPKPLLPVAGRAAIVHTLSQLAGAGVEAVAINLHYRGEDIRERLGTEFEGLPLTYSLEPELLGTLGAMMPLEEFLRPADLVLVINGDSVCRWPLKRLVRRHQRRGNLATLLLSKRANASEFGGGVVVDGAGQIRSFHPLGKSDGSLKRRVFCGAHVFSPELLAGIDKQPADFIADLYERQLEQGQKLGGVETSRRWHDLGTPKRYLRASKDWARGQFPARLWRSKWISSSARVSAKADVSRSVIEAGARVDAGARVQGSLLLPGARVPRGCRVVKCILGFDVTLAAGTAVERRLVTPATATTEPRHDDSVVSGLVFSRMSR
ncbi:MAG: NDP-sugar synthase [Acidobacteria bacterium]|nr:MAG: NDP-sugar synthase [Acidobacteriota bacterium]